MPRKLKQSKAAIAARRRYRINKKTKKKGGSVLGAAALRMSRMGRSRRGKSGITGPIRAYSQYNRTQLGKLTRPQVREAQRLEKAKK